MVLAASATYAQEWTKEQQEVWKAVQDSWTKWKAAEFYVQEGGKWLLLGDLWTHDSGK